MTAVIIYCSPCPTCGQEARWSSVGDGGRTVEIRILCLPCEEAEHGEG